MSGVCCCYFAVVVDLDALKVGVWERGDAEIVEEFLTMRDSYTSDASDPHVAGVGQQKPRGFIPASR
jgi:hypothetical protein